MSAITGIIHFNNEPINHFDGARMMKAFDHFPVDTVQTWNDQNAFFACHSQWITPESIGEKLPYYDRHRQLVITADAIIDNRQELFDRLNIKPFEQKQLTDSELMIVNRF